MIILLYVLIIITIAFFYGYYQHQNRQKTIGGPISQAKILWLGYAIFNYFIFSVWQYVQLPSDNVFRPILLALLGLLYGRLVVQTILMFGVKKWQPPMGMAYNLLCIIVLSSFFKNILKSDALDVKLGFYTIGILGTLATDTYYAYSFYKIVGRDTMGEQAIWYASDEDPQFKRINTITKYLNVIFYGLSIYVIILYTITAF